MTYFETGIHSRCTVNNLVPFLKFIYMRKKSCSLPYSDQKITPKFKPRSIVP